MTNETAAAAQAPRGRFQLYGPFLCPAFPREPRWSTPRHVNLTVGI
jgi:hypothetical protein